MNNPFGIPDEMMEVVIKAAIDNAKKSHGTEKPKNENIFQFDVSKEAKKSASMAKQLMDAYLEAGFNEQQAFALVRGILTAKRN